MADLEKRLLEIFRQLPQEVQSSLVKGLGEAEDAVKKIKNQEQRIAYLSSDSLDDYNQQIADNASDGLSLGHSSSWK